MGDAADDAIDRGMEEWLYEGDFDICYKKDKISRTCQICGAQGLQWKRHKRKWKLFDSAGEVPHTCDLKKVFK